MALRNAGLVMFISVLVGLTLGGGHVSPFVLLSLVLATFLWISGSLFYGKLKARKARQSCQVQVLLFLHGIFQFERKAGAKALQAHLEQPLDSDLFTPYPMLCQDAQLRALVADYLRLLTLGGGSARQIEGFMESDVSARQGRREGQTARRLGHVLDFLPALGLLSGLLILTFYTAPFTASVPALVLAAVLGGLVGFGLAFLGARLWGSETDGMESADYIALKAGLLAHVQGYAPEMSVEFARKSLPASVRPSFQVLEKELVDPKAVRSLPPLQDAAPLTKFKYAG